MSENTKSYILILLGIFILMIAIVTFVSFRQTSLTPAQNELEECKTLNYNGEGKINILFFGEEDEALDYTNFFLDAHPFNKYKEEFNFYYIDTYKPECELYKGIAILCHSRELIKKAASCPNDHIVVLEKRGDQIRSSAYLNVMSLNSRHLKSVFLHEFGHVFANLAEEYINNQRPPRGSPNCESSCDNFDSEINGCFKGCSLNSLERSIENGVMRTLNSVDYGLFNSRIIEEIIEDSKEEPIIGSPLAGNVVNTPNSCSSQKYNIASVSSNGEIEKITQHIGCSPQPSRFGTLAYQITQDQEILESGRINPIIRTEAQHPEEDVIVGETDIIDTVTITTSSQGEQLEILDEEGNILDSQNIETIGGRPCLIE